jgi:alpha-tubulin suppressor-like RCC1 family protein
LGVSNSEIKYSSNWNFIYNNIKDISCGQHHTLIVDNNNNTYSFGLNNFGQLGLIHFDNIYTPTKISNFKIKSISTGETFSIVLTNSNQLFSFGSNSFGELGLGGNSFGSLGLYNFNNISIPTEIDNNFTKFQIKKISCGYYHTLILDEGGDVYSFGRNDVHFF